jgi:hypothetical protein
MTGGQSNFFKFTLVFLGPWDSRYFFFEVVMFLDETMWPEAKTFGLRGCVQIKLPAGQEWKTPSTGVVPISRAAHTLM